MCSQPLKMATRRTKSLANIVVEFISNGEAVGRGKVVKVSNLDVLHGSHLPKGCYGITMIQTYGGKDANLPYPLPIEDDITTLSAAINTTIAWPKIDVVSDPLSFFVMINLFDILTVLISFSVRELSLPIHQETQ